jgi:hypothetical protein
MGLRALTVAVMPEYGLDTADAALVPEHGEVARLSDAAPAAWDRAALVGIRPGAGNVGVVRQSLLDLRRMLVYIPHINVDRIVLRQHVAFKDVQIT